MSEIQKLGQLLFHLLKLGRKFLLGILLRFDKGSIAKAVMLKKSSLWEASETRNIEEMSLGNYKAVCQTERF